MHPGASPPVTDAEWQLAADSFNAYAIRLAETYHNVQTSSDAAIPQGEDRDSWASYLYQAG